MATGYYDANGIWQYGEDDNIALFSDLLNLGQDSTSDQFTNDRARIAFLEQSVEQASTFVASSAAARDSYWGVPANATQQLALQNKGARTVRTDLGITQQYFGAYNSSTNPGGHSDGAGWYAINRSQGLTPMVPTVVTPVGTGSTATMTNVGTVDFANCNQIRLQGVFTSAYRNYQIKANILDSNDCAIVLQYMYPGGTPMGANNYFLGGVIRNMTNTTVTGYNQAAAPYTFLGNCGYLPQLQFTMELNNPQVAAMTKYSFQGTGGTPSVYENYQFGSIFPFNDQFDGFLFGTTAGTMYGTVSVYGYND